MRVDRFVSTDFRNLAAAEIEFGPGLNLLIGSNGQGKTNLLEALHTFRFGRSFRAQVDTEMIRFDAPFCRAEAACAFSDGRREVFAFSIERRGAHGHKTLKIDGHTLGRRSDLAGRFPVVLFGPSDLRIVSGEPEHRRRFFDMIGTMTDATYLHAAREYRRALEQRNAALKARVSRDEIAAWNDRLIDTGATVIVLRRRLVEEIERRLGEHARDLDSPFEFAMRYDSSLADTAAESAPAGDDAALTDALRDAFATKLAAVAYEEMRRGVTLAGPHRDDVEFRMSGHDLRRFGSQGQRRLFAVLLKLAELSHIEAGLREPCVLLLDDVFSEFDATIIARMQKLLHDTRQVFITSPVPLPDGATPGAVTFHVDNGRITRA